MVISTYNPCLLVIRNSNSTPSPFGIIGMQTDDTLILCDDQFAKLEEEELAKARFMAKPREKLEENTILYFNGCAIKLENDGTIVMTQKSQGKKITLVPTALTTEQQQQ